MKAFFMKLLKDKATKKAGESLNENGFSLSPLFKYAIFGGGGFVFFLLGVIVICVVVFAPVFLAEEYVGTVNNGFSSFFEKVGNFITLKGWCTDEECDDSFDEKFYRKLDEVYQDYKEDGVEINVNLITAAVYYNSSIGNEDADEDLISDIKPLASNMVSGNSLDYGKYRSYLVNTFIPKRFKHLYNDDKGIEKIADEIMSYASYKGNELAISNSIGISCSQITLKSQDGSLTVHELEEYVAGVATAENGGASDEALKLQVIAARSFAVKNCDRVIVNSIGDVKVDGKIDMAYKEPSDRAIAAAEATKGQVLTYNGEVFEISFASYPRANYRGGFPGYEASGYLCSDVSCSSGSDGRNWCTTTLYKQPNMESFELKMPDTSKSGSLWNGLHLSNQGGHCYGISQVATIYYENELNYTYDQMIGEFLSPGVQISSIGGFSGEVGSTDGTDFLPYELSKFLAEKGSSVDSLNASIKQAVVAAGPGTRAGVVAAANALVNGLSQYGVKLPYISSISSDSSLGKYKGYGVDSKWGTVGNWYSNVYGRPYNQQGLDCSGLVSWALHNGGFNYLEYNSGGYLDNIGVSHSFASFRGQPGDLVVKYGHIGIIVGVTDSEYLVAEEHGGENGLEITHYTFNNPREQFTHILDMTSYYSNSSNLDLSYYQGG